MTDVLSDIFVCLKQWNLIFDILEPRMTQFSTNDCISGLTKMIHMQMHVGIATIRATPEICSKENSTENTVHGRNPAPPGM